MRKLPPELRIKILQILPYLDIDEHGRFAFLPYCWVNWEWFLTLAPFYYTDFLSILPPLSYNYVHHQKDCEVTRLSCMYFKHVKGLTLAHVTPDQQGVVCQMLAWAVALGANFQVASAVLNFKAITQAIIIPSHFWANLNLLVIELSRFDNLQPQAVGNLLKLCKHCPNLKEMYLEAGETDGGDKIQGCRDLGMLKDVPFTLFASGLNLPFTIAILRGISQFTKLKSLEMHFSEGTRRDWSFTGPLMAGIKQLRLTISISTPTSLGALVATATRLERLEMVFMHEVLPTNLEFVALNCGTHVGKFFAQYPNAVPYSKQELESLERIVRSRSPGLTHFVVRPFPTASDSEFAPWE